MFRSTGSHAGVLLVSALSLAACGTEVDPGDDGDAQAAAEDTHMEHIHGLGINEADGALMIASHYGLFRLDDDGPVRVSEVQDFMGFTVAEEGLLLASGHPGQGQDAPTNLGLIASIDDGATWDEVSLGGEADFHALDALGERIYGVDATSGQQLMISDDGGETWETSNAPAMASLTVDPRDADTVIGTTEEGPVLSDDGGQEFLALDGAPVLQFVDWAADGTLYGMDPAAGVHRSLDDGATWEQVGEVGSTAEGHPEAIHAVDQDEVWAAVGGSVLHSTDGGESFDVVHES